MTFKKTQFKTNSSKTNPNAELLKKKIASLENQIRLLEANGMEVDEAISKALSEAKHKLSPNKKGAKSIYFDGIEWDSIIEKDFAEMLKQEGYERGVHYTINEHFEIQPSFRIKEGVVRSIDLFVDFVVFGKYAIDCKGYFIDAGFKVKWKMLKNIQRDNLEYFLPTNKKELREVLTYIKLQRNKNELFKS